MVSVDSADLAEIMFRRFGIELIKRKIILATNEFYVRELRRNGNGTPHSAVRACASPDRVELIRQSNSEHD